MRRSLPLLFLLLATLTSCRVWARVEHGFAWKIVGPKEINRGEDLVFHVQAYSPDGVAAEGYSILWAIDWVGVRGSRHKGRTFSMLDIRSKGSTGRGAIRVYAYDADGNVSQVAKEEFEVK